MSRAGLLIVLFLSCLSGYAQEAEACRYEVTWWGKDQDCHFVPLQEQGGMMVYETDKLDDDKNRLWNFVTLDSSLYETHAELLPLPQKMEFFDAKSSDEWIVFVFLTEKKQRSDSIGLTVVTYRRGTREFDTFNDRLPAKSSLLSISLLDASLMLAVNERTGNGFLAWYDLDTGQHRKIIPNIGNDFVLFQCVADPSTGRFVLAVREYVEKRYKATSFLVYGKSGINLQQHRFENSENAGLGRMCFSFDESGRLVVISTLEMESNKKVDVEGVTADFSKIAVGVVWIKFTTPQPLSKTYLFKSMPEIEQALTASDRLRVREEQLKMKQGKKQEQGEIAFQFLAPRQVSFAGQQVFVAEAFRPIYHTETRMEYGFYGTYPVHYTVFDGYDFFSEILLAFDSEGELQWQQSVRFDNDLSYELYSHISEMVSHDELLVVSPSRHRLRYEVFDADGSPLLDQHVFPLDFLYRTDSFVEEYTASVDPWYGDRFLVRGCQVVQNPSLRNTQRIVFYVQKVQYE